LIINFLLLSHCRLPSINSCFVEVCSYHQVFSNTQTLTYKVPSRLSLQRGDIVDAPFGKYSISGVVINVLEKSNFKDIEKIKEITEKSNLKIQKKSIDLAVKMSAYYNVPLYKCISLFLPKDILYGYYKPTQTVIIEKGDLWEERLDLVRKNATKQKALLELLEKLFNGESDKGVDIQDLYKENFYKQDLKSLIEKKLIISIAKENLKDPSLLHKKRGSGSFDLNEDQKKVFSSLVEKRDIPHLIYGITGSGKTEVYIKLIQHLFSDDDNSQIIVLVPEINLTPQLISRFRDYFDNISVWHSKLSPQEKLDQWTKIHRRESRIIIGSRSALFTPVQNLKAIIVDEEHDSSFKQMSAPRYDIHTVAEMYFKVWNCHLVFGSATPKIESFYKAKKGIYGFSVLKNRFNSNQLPDVSIVDLTQEKLESKSVLSYPLQLGIRQALDKKEQILIFLNRRGFANTLMCKDCGWNHTCDVCDISTTYHVYKDSAYLRCHCCGKTTSTFTTCPSCKSHFLFPLGSGTQRLEEELAVRFPESRILRIDQDTTSTKHAYRKAYEKISLGEIDIIVGTQMIAKGLDMPNVTLVGIILADYGLHIPDFRAEEYSYQVLSQVSGRSGRHKPGKVIVQTLSASSNVIKAVQSHNTDELYESILDDRKQFDYPPFVDLVKLEFVHPSFEKCKYAAMNLALHLRHAYLDDEKVVILGPSPALIVRQSNKYHYHIVVKHSFSEEQIQKFFDKIPKDWKIDRNPYHVV